MFIHRCIFIYVYIFLTCRHIHLRRERERESEREEQRARERNNERERGTEREREEQKASERERPPKDARAAPGFEVPGISAAPLTCIRGSGLNLLGSSFVLHVTDLGCREFRSRV